MESEAFNHLVAAAARKQPLRGVKRAGRGTGPHHWKVRTERVGDRDGRQWRVFVGPGAVNDRVAVITYLRENDPRGWTMPPDYPARGEMARFYGDAFPIVDRRLTELADPPHLLAETPLGNDAGDFMRVPDDTRRPEFFRTPDRWKRQLWKASVFVSATPARFSRVENRLHFPLPTKNVRYRIGISEALPKTEGGVQAGGAHELARVYLLREPGNIEADEIFVQQRCFWSLWTMNVAPFFDLDPFVATASFPLIGLGGVGALGAVGLVLGFNLVTDALFREIAAGFEKPSSVEFWSA